jgi:hypothetical protein
MAHVEQLILIFWQHPCYPNLLQMIAYASIWREAQMLVGIPSVSKVVLAYWCVKAMANCIIKYSPIVSRALLSS